jgi:4-hydroxybenzoate polyprenyltransferase
VKSFIRFLVFSNILVAFCVLALAISSELLLETGNHQISQFVFFATLFTYNFQRVVRVKKGANHVRKQWLIQNSIVIFFLLSVSAFVSAYHFIDFKIQTQITILFAGLLSILYPFGLRKIPFSKIFVISLVWTISTMLLLVLENNVQFSQHIVFHLVSRFLFVFAITIPFDIRDLKYDSHKLRTIPLFFGVPKARIIAIISVFICGIIAIFQFSENALISSNLLALILLYFMASIFIIKSDENKGEMYFSFWVESLSIALYFFLAISSLMF